MLEPINKRERILAQRKFVGVYILSLIITALITYFWTRSTTDKLKAENEQLNKLMSLLVSIDSVGSQLNTLNKIDESFGKNQESKVLSYEEDLKVNKAENTMRIIINKVKADSASFVAGVAVENRKVVAGVIDHIDVLLGNWTILKLLRGFVKKGETDFSAIENCKRELEMSRMDVKNLENQLRMASMMRQGPTSTPSHSSGGNCEKYIEENLNLKLKVKDLENEISHKAAPVAPPPSSIIINNSDANADARRMLVEADCSKMRGMEGRKRKSKSEIERLYDDAYKTLKQIVDNPEVNANLKTLAQEKIKEILKYKKSIPFED
ncbi:hypothetical protein [Emticicia soli]|uniref:Uncharacterized protein n=1 Tax=Emticicia soli TaxID=2027878 RepID=A0ABW5J4Y9_9BACT